MEKVIEVNGAEYKIQVDRPSNDTYEVTVLKNLGGSVRRIVDNQTIRVADEDTIEDALHVAIVVLCDKLALRDI
ncbi:hypothetical protein [Alicyclobacillus sp. ALC3]|uniref:hypothetical protein n=1 Tax=Alicyclobacillus sp. ALC3 TaxID=2796143 RepID=UPI002379D444|nr:hypothetical protein [Alicyclobacillus sp. ALC3]WDL99178.1 hypothetical protein JC200_11355 [Alicyclobacillus sp. ALC3]